jgi:hypothetical protein
MVGVIMAVSVYVLREAFYLSLTPRIRDKMAY